MAISTIGMYNKFLAILSKNNSEYFSPEEFVAFYKMASDDMFNDYLGNKTNRRAVYGHNSITDNRLNPFRVSGPAEVYNPETRLIPIPEPCKHIRSVIDNFADPIKYQDDNRFYTLKKDVLVDLKLNAYYKEEGKFIEIMTEKPITTVSIQYLKSPGDPKLPYSTPDREIVFDTAGVVDLDWDDDQELNLLSRMMTLAGIPLRDPTVLQMGRVMKNEE